MKQSSLNCRAHGSYEKSDPFPLINGEYVVNENGVRKFVERDPVAPSMACDFSVVSNAMYHGFAISQVRDNIDPVDMLEKYSEVFND